MVVKIVDKGFAKYYKAVEELNGSQIRVGLFSAVGDKVLTKGIVNEFGTNEAGKNRNIKIPERSFIRATYNKQYKKVAKRFSQIFRSFIDRKYSVVPRLKLIGIEQEMATKKTLTDLKSPPNSPSTVARKGSNNPLIDTGELRSKISSEVKNK